MQTFASAGENPGISRAVKGLWGPGANLLPASPGIASLLGLPPRLRHSRLEPSSLCLEVDLSTRESSNYWEELSHLHGKWMPWNFHEDKAGLLEQSRMSILPLHRGEGHTCGEVLGALVSPGPTSRGPHWPHHQGSLELGSLLHLQCFCIMSPRSKPGSLPPREKTAPTPQLGHRGVPS